MKKNKKLDLGKIEIIDLGEDMNASQLEDLFDFQDPSAEVGELASYAYGTTNGCSDSCGSTTICC